MSQSAAERQRRFRERQKTRRTITISVTKEEGELLDKSYDQSQDPNIQRFYKEALLTGAKFRANSGTPIGKKIK